MLVQFERAVAPSQDPEFEGSGEDEGFAPPVEPTPSYLTVNPRYVSMVFQSREPGVTIIKGPDGRGFKVRGDYADVHAKLLAGGMEEAETTQH